MDVKVRNLLPWTSYDIRRTEEGLVYRFASVSFFDKTLVTVSGHCYVLTFETVYLPGIWLDKLDDGAEHNCPCLCCPARSASKGPSEKMTSCIDRPEVKA